jgi:hypothetical protein
MVSAAMGAGPGSDIQRHLVADRTTFRTRRGTRIPTVALDERLPGARGGARLCYVADVRFFEHDAVLIDGTPEIMQFALDPDEDIIQLPFIQDPFVTPAKIVCEAGAELQASPPDALVRDDHAALGQNQFYIPIPGARG